MKPLFNVLALGGCVVVTIISKETEQLVSNLVLPAVQKGSVISRVRYLYTNAGRCDIGGIHIVRI